MTALDRSVITLLYNQGFVIVSTLNSRGHIHCAAKGVVDCDERGIVYLVDLYRGETSRNIEQNPTVSITAVDEHQFCGYTLQGHARCIEREKIEQHLQSKWEEKILSRVSKRIITNVKKERGSLKHPEIRFPSPEAVLAVTVEHVINLAPEYLKTPT